MYLAGKESLINAREDGDSSWSSRKITNITIDHCAGISTWICSYALLQMEKVHAYKSTCSIVTICMQTPDMMHMHSVHV